MSSENRRLVLFLVLSFVSVVGAQYLMDAFGLLPHPVPQPNPALAKKAGPDDAVKPVDVSEKTKGKDQEKPPAVAQNETGKGKANDDEKDKDKDKDKNKDQSPVARKATIKPVDPDALILGSVQNKSKGDYHLEVQLDQKGAGVWGVRSSRYDAEFAEGEKRNQRRPLELLQHDALSPPTMALSLMLGQAAPSGGEASPTLTPEGGDLALDLEPWEVVLDDQGRTVRPISKEDPTIGQIKGQEVVFKTVVESLGVAVTKTFRLFKGEDGFECTLDFAGLNDKDRTFSYRLLGPHGIPIEGEWYTGTFRDAFFGQIKGETIEVVTKPASDIAKPKAAEFDNSQLPLAFAGIENQYFASFVSPFPFPRNQNERHDSRAVAIVLHQKEGEPQKADIGVEIHSKQIAVGPNRTVTHNYKVFAGPKVREALEPFGAEKLATYRKYQLFGIPFAGWMASNVIAPMLEQIYKLTATVSHLFGGSKGNYGIAIILLTLTVRMVMFPIGRKQALMAQKMQKLQPLLKEIQEKYKDDKEQQTKETFSLYKRQGVNPVGGCLPALIQLPIFVGLWQALNNSVHLRHASFLWIQNLAAPDMLFPLPFDVPLIGGFVGHYFNILPIFVVGLMIVQTKLFAPPATTPEAEMQQNMMKYMMVFMGFMFYKVPSGLGLYFITSSSWQIGERLLLPKITHLPPTPGGGDGKEPPPGGGRGGPDGNEGGPPAKRGGWLGQQFEKLLAEASKDTTIRNADAAREQRDRDRDRDQNRGKPRSRPGRRR